MEVGMAREAQVAKNTEFLSAFWPFRIFDDVEIERIAAIAICREIAKGEQIIREGECAKSLFIIESGSVDVLKGVEAGHPSCVSHLKKWEMFGEMSFVEKSLTTAHVFAHEKTVLIELPFTVLEQLGEENLALGKKLYRILSLGISTKLKQSTEHLLSQILASPVVELGQMAMAIGHEINTPLSSLEMVLENIQENLKNETINKDELKEDVEISKSVVERITRIIRGLKIVGRNAQNDPPMKVNLKSLVGETVEFCSQRFKTSHVKLDVGEISESVVLECRPVQFSQALLNLLNNAFDAISPLKEKWVRVEANDLGNDILISVIDSGSGVPEHVRSKMFQAFFTSKPPGQGTGLGLCISRKLIESHGGSLDIDSSHKNTCFQIRLPKVTL